MKRRLLVLPCTMMLGVWAPVATPEPEIQYFKQVRDVSILKPDHQAYVVIDTNIWSHARPDLSDLRLYDGSIQIPYQLVSENASTTAQEVEAKMLNLAQHGDHAEFDLDVSPVTEYNRIHLAIDRKDFVITASIAGGETLGGASTQWPSPSTLFDFSRENLGSNSTIALPLWSFALRACAIVSGHSRQGREASHCLEYSGKESVLDGRGHLPIRRRAEAHFGLHLRPPNGHSRGSHSVRYSSRPRKLPPADHDR